MIAELLRDESRAAASGGAAARHVDTRESRGFDRRVKESEIGQPTADGARPWQAAVATLW